MSRIADALLKAGASPFPGFSRGAGATSAPDWVTAEIPWDLGQLSAPAHPGGVTTSGAAPAAAASRLDGARGRHSDATLVARDELLPLVQHILHGGVGGAPVRALIFAGTDSEASAEVCAAAAATLADQVSGSVCLVDANLRSPSLHTLCGIEGTRGLADLLREPQEVRACLQEITDNLWLLPAAMTCGDGSPLLGSDRLSRCIADIRAAFDFVLVATSPLSHYSDVVALGSVVEAAVLVLEANATRREVAKRTAQHLQDANVRVFGAVLTNRTFPIPEAIYRKL
jgi:Mrp family chromosome partitioning ATPase